MNLSTSITNENNRFNNSFKKEVMTSLEIAELTGKRHSDVLEAIRTMENAWEKVTQRKFPLSEYKDSTGRKLPMYNLSKTECLYVATKFNDEARAKLVLRWEKLETERCNSGFNLPRSLKEALLFAAMQQEEIEEQQKQIESMSTEIVEMKTDYLEIILQSKETVTTTQIAQDYGMSAKALNRTLAEMKIQRKVNGQWILYAPYISQGYVHSKTVPITHNDGRKDTVLNTEWRQKGRIFLYNKLKEIGVLPLIER